MPEEENTYLYGGQPADKSIQQQLLEALNRMLYNAGMLKQRLRMQGDTTPPPLFVSSVESLLKQLNVFVHRYEKENQTFPKIIRKLELMQSDITDVENIVYEASLEFSEFSRRNSFAALTWKKPKAFDFLGRNSR